MKAASFVPLAKEHIAPILKIEAESNASPWSERSFEQEIGHGPSEFIVAKSQGEIVGYAGGWIVADECHVTTIAVVPSMRRRGIGRSLMIDLLERSRQRGALCATLEVRASNIAAIRLYEGLGFVSAGLRKAYYPNNREDAVIMWLHGLDTWTA